MQVSGRFLLDVAAVLAFAGCSDLAPGASVATSGPPIEHRAEDQGFVLVVSVPSGELVEGDPIPIETTLTWTGAAPKASIWGSGMGPVAFVVQEVGGRQRAMGGVMTADCAKKAFDRGVPLVVPVQKSTGWSGDDPNAEFYRAWQADPAFRLPAGTWRLDVSVSGYLAPCDVNADSFELRVPPIGLSVKARG